MLQRAVVMLHLDAGRLLRDLVGVLVFLGVVEVLIPIGEEHIEQIIYRVLEDTASLSS